MPNSPEALQLDSLFDNQYRATQKKLQKVAEQLTDESLPQQLDYWDSLFINLDFSQLDLFVREFGVPVGRAAFEEISPLQNRLSKLAQREQAFEARVPRDTFQITRSLPPLSLSRAYEIYEPIIDELLEVSNSTNPPIENTPQGQAAIITGEALHRADALFDVIRQDKDPKLVLPNLSKDELHAFAKAAEGVSIDFSGNTTPEEIGEVYFKAWNRYFHLQKDQILAQSTKPGSLLSKQDIEEHVLGRLQTEVRNLIEYLSLATYQQSLDRPWLQQHAVTQRERLFLVHFAGLRWAFRADSISVVGDKVYVGDFKSGAVLSQPAEIQEVIFRQALFTRLAIEHWLMHPDALISLTRPSTKSTRSSEPTIVNITHGESTVSVENYVRTKQDTQYQDVVLHPSKDDIEENRQSILQFSLVYRTFYREIHNRLNVKRGSSQLHFE